MAQAKSFSDDPIEQVSNWVQVNRKVLLYGAISLGAAGAAILVYRSTTASTQANASTALYEAQAPLNQGNLSAAQTELQKVVTRYGSTLSGQQATILLAQVLYDQKQYDAGISALEKARAGASPDFRATMEAMMAVGYEYQGKLDKAADQYAKAASAARFDGERSGYLASQARTLQAAGQLVESKALWEQLVLEDGTAASQEARVRLGEIAGAGK